MRPLLDAIAGLADLLTQLHYKNDLLFSNPGNGLGDRQRTIPDYFSYNYFLYYDYFYETQTELEF